ncbi:MAG: class I adenylate-forming enzyme family protein [Gammaproteobacteria bacterium]|nr:class I adenylate-forming enzyme family protein [Gammaproteobacteria bacterium]
MAEPSVQPELEALIRDFTAPGAPYELITADVDGTPMPVFRNAPPNLLTLYAEAADAFPDRDCYVYEGERYTYQDVWRTAARVANALSAAGVRPGDRVGIAMRNYPEWVLAFMGITSLGAVAVAMNAWWTGEELRYGMVDSGLKVLFADAERLERVEDTAAELDITLIAVRADTPAHTNWTSFIADAGEQMPTASTAPDDNALILYTSGSTSHPKGVLSSHRAVLHALLGWECAAAMAAELAAPPADADLPAMILTVPLFHVSGLNVQLLSSFRQGRKLVGMYKWDPEEALKIIEAERITQFNGVPTMSWELIQSPNFHSYDTSSLKSMGGGGAAMAPEHARQIDARLPTGAAGTGYGMTETNGLATTIAGEALLERPRSCGRPTPPIVSIKVVDEAGRELPRGETGEIWIHGPMNFRGYWNDADATQATLSDGWVHTGDVGHMDDEDYVFITDRAKDMVIRGGENIGCQEVEAAIYDHPAVSECAVFGLPDERLGETLAAVIMRKPGMPLEADDVKAHVAGHLARFKVPERIWIRDEQLPRIASGKIYKRGLRDQALADLERKS